MPACCAPSGRRCRSRARSCCSARPCSTSWRLRWLQLDEALSILSSRRSWSRSLSGPMLGEWVGWRRWTAICVGFVGVLLVTRPGFGGMHPAALLSLGGPICYGFYAIITRILSRVDSSETTLFYANLVGALVMLPVMPFVWTTPESWLIAADADGHGRARQRRAFLADLGPPAGAGLGAVALHLHPAGLGRDRSAIWCSAMCRTAGPWRGRPSSSPPASICSTANARWARPPPAKVVRSEGPVGNRMSCGAAFIRR